MFLSRCPLWEMELIFFVHQKKLKKKKRKRKNLSPAILTQAANLQYHAANLSDIRLRTHVPVTNKTVQKLMVLRPGLVLFGV